MKIKIIEEASSIDAIFAWRSSRDSGHLDDNQKVMSIDAPVNDMPSFFLEIECTIFEREIFTSMRDHVIWARSSRVDDIENFEVDKNFKRDLRYEAIRDKIRESDASQDETRMMLPLVSMTKFCCRISIRSLAKVGLYFSRLGHLAKQSEVRDMFFSAAKEILDLVNTEYTHLSFSEIAILNESWIPGNKVISSNLYSNVLTISMSVPFALRSQISRGRGLSIQDNIFFNIDEIPDATQSYPVSIIVSGAKETWRIIFKNRSCWMTQSDLWFDIITEVQRNFEFNETSLPCSDLFCPFSGDAEKRLTQDDPGAPCPIYLKQIGHDITEDFRGQIEDQIDREKRNDFWRKMI